MAMIQELLAAIAVAGTSCRQAISISWTKCGPMA